MEMNEKNIDIIKESLDNIIEICKEKSEKGEVIDSYFEYSIEAKQLIKILDITYNNKTIKKIMLAKRDEITFNNDYAYYVYNLEHVLNQL